MAQKLTAKEHIKELTTLLKQVRDNVRGEYMSDHPTDGLEALAKKVKYFRTKFKIAPASLKPFNEKLADALRISRDMDAAAWYGRKFDDETLARLLYDYASTLQKELGEQLGTVQKSLKEFSAQYTRSGRSE